MRWFLACPLVAACCWPALAVERQEARPELARVKRIYVEQLGGGQTSDQMRDMIIAALENCGLFILTENPERADAVLRGSSDDKVFTEDHITSDSIGMHANASEGSSSRNYYNGTSSHAAGGAGISDSENSRIQERKHEASASIRLVDAQGDVIWSTTQESYGGKFRGAMADVADKIMRQLRRHAARAERANRSAVSAPLRFRRRS
jgi:hypothetical protein